MSRKYDIVERLKAANERPFICVAEGKVYTVDTGKTTGFHIQAVGKDESLDELEINNYLLSILSGLDIKDIRKHISEKINTIFI